MEKLKFALIGRDVERSPSPEIHSFIAFRKGREISYSKISVPPENFSAEIGKLLENYDGLNVTMPYKISIIPYLEEISGGAEKCGAVNTVVCRSKSGYNTDGAGFMLSLQTAGLDFSGKSVLVLGAGGAGRSVATELSASGADVSVYNRSFGKALAFSRTLPRIKAVEKAEIKPYAAVINATGMGMNGSEGQSPCGGGLLELCDVAIDLIYKPETSAFLKTAQSYGKKIMNGGDMLFYQAYFSQCIFFGESPQVSEAKEFLKEYRESGK